MKTGAAFPTCDFGNDPEAIKAYAQAAENLGYDQIVTFDHVLGAVHADRDPPLLEGGYDETHPFHEPFVLFAFMAAVTKSIGFTTEVLVLPKRQTALVAKQAAELAVLSNNRLRLGVGTGWNWVEYEALGVPFTKSGARMDEQIKLLRDLWSGEVVDFQGEYHRIDRASILPVPTKKIPILIGGFGPRPLRRAATLGDGFLFPTWRPPLPDVCKQFWDEVEKSGRPRDEFEVEVMVHYSSGKKNWIKIAEEWKAMGASRIALNTVNVVGNMGDQPTGFTTPQQHIDALADFRDALKDI